MLWEEAREELLSSKKAAIYDGCNRRRLARSGMQSRILREGNHLRRLQPQAVGEVSHPIADPQRRQPSTTAATCGRATHDRLVRSSKKAAIYDGCNFRANCSLVGWIDPQRRQPSTTAATPGCDRNARPRICTPQRRQPSTTAATGTMAASSMKTLPPQRRQPSTTAAT